MFLTVSGDVDWASIIREVGTLVAAITGLVVALKARKQAEVAKEAAAVVGEKVERNARRIRNLNGETTQDEEGA